MTVDGVELLRLIRDGELKENTKLIDDFNYEYFYEKDEWEDLILYEFDNIVHKKIIPDYTMFPNNHFKILTEDEEIDIDNMEELLKIEEYEVDKTDTVINRDAINELIRAVKKIKSEVNQLKECKSKLNWKKAEESANKLKEKYNNL